ncbi:NAD(+) diphosphatase [Marinibacterium profundimaris]|uniref:NAD(+) diphosphatase n=1 Tax=Marinibacterium profundimaris TaxID=1679460 RepID=A0A225NI48_9RHOB|nr:NAD(+) diphosphatase [Marinibacterium profundimaris]OWU73486.1 NUDIX hydrolase [Marinibacterium profundimaris]
MKRAEQVTFGGSRLDRAAHLRGNPAALAEARAHPDAASILMWRGKPMVCGPDGDRLAFVTTQHPVISAGHDSLIGGPILLGIDDTGPLFATDLSDWTPGDIDESALDHFVDTSLQRYPGFPEDHVFAELRQLMTRLNPRHAELVAAAKALIGWHGIHPFCARCGARSEITQGGWQRTCPACGAHHFPRTDPVVIMLITHGNSVLMGRSPGWPEGMYSLLAGFIEPGETLEAAVRREVWEESGVKVGEVGYLASQPWPFPASLMFGCWGRAETREITVDPVEIEDALWVTRSDMMDAFAGTHPFIKPARKGAIAHFLLQNWLADTLE